MFLKKFDFENILVDFYISFYYIINTITNKIKEIKMVELEIPSVEVTRIVTLRRKKERRVKA